MLVVHAVPVDIIDLGQKDHLKLGSIAAPNGDLWYVRQPDNRFSVQLWIGRHRAFHKQVRPILVIDIIDQVNNIVDVIPFRIGLERVTRFATAGNANNKS